MPFISSPVAYPPTSSPPADKAHASRKAESPRKKRKISHDENGSIRQPLANIPANLQTTLIESQAEDHIKKGPVLLGGFLVDEDDDDEDEAEPAQIPGDVDASIDLTKQDDTMESSTASKSNIDTSFQRIFGRRVPVRTCSGDVVEIREKPKAVPVSYEKLIASRSSKAVNSNAQKAFYGVDIHNLIHEARNNAMTEQGKDDLTTTESIEPIIDCVEPQTKIKTLLWTEKYRARKFTDLVGDERTHRSVLRWLKGWDSIVFPHQARQKPKSHLPREDQNQDRPHRKVLLLTGPPGLGKTTMAHVCAKQAGYEVQEINASDERSRDVVKGRIRDMVATENVRTVGGPSANAKKAARPVCVIVDEVDGVVSGSGGSGEGGFIKALTELLALDQKNSAAVVKTGGPEFARKKKKGDNFRLLRPLVLICNDVYHPSLRLLRQNSLAEVIHVRKPALTMVVPRLQSIFEKEGLSCDGDGVRRLCEAAWGVSSRKEDAASSGGSSEGDVRSVLVIGEWVAAKFRAGKTQPDGRLSRRWLEDNVLGELDHGGGAARSLGRGGSKEIVDRVFKVNAGFPVSSSATSSASNKSFSHLSTSTDATLGPTEVAKRTAHARLREMVESTGEDDRIATDLFSVYPTHPFQDDTTLTKPCAAHDWLYFHDRVSGLVHTQQEWEMAPYLSQSVVAFHHLFASATRKTGPSFTNEYQDHQDKDQAQKEIPFTGPRASFEAHESQKQHTATLTHLHSSLSLHLHRAFRSPSHLATELLPYAMKLLNPDVKPVIVGGSGTDKSTASVRRASEKLLVSRAVSCMLALGITFSRSKIDDNNNNNNNNNNNTLSDSLDTATKSLGIGASSSSGWIYRMDPALDSTATFETLDTSRTESKTEKVRFAVRQVLESEHARQVAKRESDARLRRGGGGNNNLSGFDDEDSVNPEDGKATNNTQKPIKETGPERRIKKDFFGRPITPLTSSIPSLSKDDSSGETPQQSGARSNRPQSSQGQDQEHNRIWVSFNEGYSNAVRRPVTMKELLGGL